MTPYSVVDKGNMLGHQAGRVFEGFILSGPGLPSATPSVITAVYGLS